MKFGILIIVPVIAGISLALSVAAVSLVCAGEWLIKKICD